MEAANARYNWIAGFGDGNVVVNKIIRGHRVIGPSGRLAHEVAQACEMPRREGRIVKL